jgi:hypothetical protein
VTAPRSGSKPCSTLERTRTARRSGEFWQFLYGQWKRGAARHPYRENRTVWSARPCSPERTGNAEFLSAQQLRRSGFRGRSASVRSPSSRTPSAASAAPAGAVEGDEGRVRAGESARAADRIRRTVRTQIKKRFSDTLDSVRRERPPKGTDSMPRARHPLVGPCSNFAANPRCLPVMSNRCGASGISSMLIRDALHVASLGVSDIRIGCC